MATLEAIGRAIDRVGDMVLKHTIGGSGSSPDKYERAEDRLRTMYIGAQRKRIAKLEAVLRELDDAWVNSSADTAWPALDGRLADIVRHARELLTKARVRTHYADRKCASDKSSTRNG